MLSVDEINFQKKYGHSSRCNCIRLWRGKLIVTRRMCTCSELETIKDNQQLHQSAKTDEP
jgi:hypothetical protein